MIGYQIGKQTNFRALIIFLAEAHGLGCSFLDLSFFLEVSVMGEGVGVDGKGCREGVG